jgi:hypothetical protein
VASRLMLNSPYYCDRGYVFTDIPSFLGGTAIITTANNDKKADASDTEFLCFDISEPATVYVLYDIRIPEPAWLLSLFTDQHVRRCCKRPYPIIPLAMSRFSPLPCAPGIHRLAH